MHVQQTGHQRAVTQLNQLCVPWDEVRVNRLQYAVAEHYAHGPGDRSGFGIKHAVSSDDHGFGVGAGNEQGNKQYAELLLLRQHSTF